MDIEQQVDRAYRRLQPNTVVTKDLIRAVINVLQPVNMVDGDELLELAQEQFVSVGFPRSEEILAQITYLSQHADTVDDPRGLLETIHSLSCEPR